MNDNVHSLTPEIILQANSDLHAGNLVVLLGGTRTGKSWLIERLFDQEHILDRKGLALAGEDCKPLSFEEIQEWSEKAQGPVAVDEIQLLTRAELIDIAFVFAPRKNGILLATQKLEWIPNELISEFIDKDKQVAVIHLESWKPGTRVPRWDIHRIESDKSFDLNS